MKEINLGDEVRDTISGFKGKAVARTDWLYNCVRITVQPPVDEKGKLPQMESFDIDQLEVTKPAKKTKEGKSVTGGPCPTPSRAPSIR